MAEKEKHMKSLKLNTILNLLDYYWEICDEDVEAGNRLICTIEDLLPFNGYDEVKDWALTTECGTGEEWLEMTYDVLWNAAIRDYYIIRDMLKGAKFSEWSVEAQRFQTSSVIHWDNDVLKPVATITVNAPFIGFENTEEGVWQGSEFRDFIEDTIMMLRAKIKQIAKRLDREVKNEDL